MQPLQLIVEVHQIVEERQIEEVDYLVVGRAQLQAAYGHEHSSYQYFYLAP